MFADEALTAKKTPFDAKYPAASFTPEVIYADSKLILEAKTAVKKPVRKIEFDPRYPAAHFEPKVIYP
ncbi:MAG: hypothetical protein CVV13_12970 [Gammaproteobacteria bacterium HGW-Gammaproteobacteria-3]|nr:MAG: hypothetical protein CVV13_12970 [Gammaproteobacteria bacterium HGW-Gammaproteobacteria-3]